MTSKKCIVKLSPEEYNVVADALQRYYSITMNEAFVAYQDGVEWLENECREKAETAQKIVDKLEISKYNLVED
jgi:capsule polysaccharide export protein KpsC/LpsZ